jgi:hypothetical protein
MAISSHTGDGTSLLVKIPLPTSTDGDRRPQSVTATPLDKYGN